MSTTDESSNCICGHPLHLHLLDRETGELVCAQVVCECASFIPAEGH